MNIGISVRDLRFTARLEDTRAPRTCAAFLALLPFHNTLIQARWSGEAGWIPLGSLDVGLSPENEASEPTPGQLLFYPGGYSETEILFPYGVTRFASKLGVLAGNHFLTIVDGAAQFDELGKRLLREGAQDITMHAEG